MSLYELPNEVLEMIFYHSDNKLNISVTCSRFYDIIAASPELMDGICLFFEKFGYVCRQYGKKNLYPPVTQEKADELVQKMLEPLMLSKRRYSHAYIHDYYCTEILKVVEKHSSTITNLSISAQPGDVLMDHSSFSDVMVALSDSLQLLRINCNAIHLNPNKLIYALELPILKGVEMIAAESLGVLQILMKSRIKNLRITTVEDFPYTVDNIKYLVDFLSVQDDLKVLDTSTTRLMTKGVLTRDTERTNRLPHWFDDAPEKLTDDDVVDRFKFNLLELSWEMDVQSDSTKINQFLRKQSNLEVFKGELKSSSIGCLMRELPNLTQVQLDVFETYLVGDRVHKRHFNERGFYLPLRNENWQNINIRELISVRRADMFKFCPNVEIAGVCVGELIILQSAWDEKLCPRLRKILIHDYHRSTRGISADISFPFIKDVEFSTYCSNEMMIEYISQNKHIETLTFNRKYGDKLEKAELTFILKTCKNLKHLIAPYQIDFYEDWSDFAEIINEYGENLEYMKLRNIQVVLDVIKKIRSQKLKFDLLSNTPCNMSREFIK